MIHLFHFRDEIQFCQKHFWWERKYIQQIPPVSLKKSLLHKLRPNIVQTMQSNISEKHHLFQYLRFYLNSSVFSISKVEKSLKNFVSWKKCRKYLARNKSLTLLRNAKTNLKSESRKVWVHHYQQRKLEGSKNGPKIDKTKSESRKVWCASLSGKLGLS